MKLYVLNQETAEKIYLPESVTDFDSLQKWNPQDEFQLPGISTLYVKEELQVETFKGGHAILVAAVVLGLLIGIFSGAGLGLSVLLNVILFGIAAEFMHQRDIQEFHRKVKQWYFEV